jgi:hypothetical protein
MTKRPSKNQNHQSSAPPAQEEHPLAQEPAGEAKPPFRAGSKQALLHDLLTRERGASLEELATATGWLPHTTRAALTGLRKRGFAVDKAKVEGTTRYRIEASA